MTYIKYLILPILLISSGLLSQGISPTNDPTAFPAAKALDTKELRLFDASFPEQNVGFLHVYANPSVGPNENYLLRGEEMEAAAFAVLPEKFQDVAKKLNAKVYAAAAIRGENESLYIVRFDGPASDRIEMFAVRGAETKHLKTLAYYDCSDNGCRQLDSYLTDIDLDTNLDLIQISRKPNVVGEWMEEKASYKMVEPARIWQKAEFKKTPWSSIVLHKQEEGK